MTTLDDRLAVTIPSATPEFEGVWNLRDLGGQPVSGGGRTRPGRVFRGATLWFATASDCNILNEFGFDTVIDLRLPKEELHEEDWLCELLDLRYHHLPIDPVDEPGVITLVHDGGAEHYVQLLEHNVARYVRALALVSDPDNHPVLFHCAAGNDRTGLLAALVLACLNVDEAAIVADYAESDSSVHRIVDRYRGHPLYDPSSAHSPGHRVHAMVMEEFLARMGGRDGIVRWALTHGLPESALRSMRSTLVQSDAG